MKILIAIVLTALLAFLGGLWLPWWSIAVAAFIVSLLVYQSAGKAFVGGFLGLFLLWGGLAWWIDVQNQGILSKKIASVLPLNGNAALLIFITALIGALVAGAAAITGSLLRSASK
jgi:hypothetical protein